MIAFAVLICLNLVDLYSRTKLSLSHALSQSVKISLVRYFVHIVLPSSQFSQFEDLISSTIDQTKSIPEVISETGKVGMTHKGTFYIQSRPTQALIHLSAEIMQQIGELFLLRININLVGSVLDSPVSIYRFLNSMKSTYCSHH